ncbi:MAG: dihydrofolate reductase family protein [Maribacter sp.]|uniref:dihydrofolate reductase family protein n=1 Tax=Maribacter sp. TaxID=1897614 RepID=UPI003298E249
MNKVIYYVATSLDGFISGVDGDISKFPFQGEAVEKYQADLLNYKTVIMGRKTYEFGYEYGLEPGQPAYPHMEHYIFSETLQIKDLAKNVHIEEMTVERIKEIVASSPTDVYLCGGGEFAGWLLDNKLIDQLKLKLNPILLGEGVRLFGNSKTSLVGTLVASASFDGGLQFLTYDLK